MAEETVGCGVDLMQDQAQPDDPEPEGRRGNPQAPRSAPAHAWRTVPAGVTACRANSCSTAAASMPARVAKS
jgi:hypothetical protein